MLMLTGWPTGSNASMLLTTTSLGSGARLPYYRTIDTQDTLSDFHMTALPPGSYSNLGGMAAYSALPYRTLSPCFSNSTSGKIAFACRILL